MKSIFEFANIRILSHGNLMIKQYSPDNETMKSYRK